MESDDTRDRACTMQAGCSPVGPEGWPGAGEAHSGSERGRTGRGDAVGIDRSGMGNQPARPAAGRVHTCMYARAGGRVLFVTNSPIIHLFNALRTCKKE